MNREPGETMEAFKVRAHRARGGIRRTLATAARISDDSFSWAIDPEDIARILPEGDPARARFIEIGKTLSDMAREMSGLLEPIIVRLDEELCALTEGDAGSVL